MVKIESYSLSSGFLSFFTSLLPPLFIYGLAAALGALLPHRSFTILGPFFFLIMVFSGRRAPLFLLIGACFYLYSNTTILWPKDSSLTGTARLKITEKRKTSSFQYRGTLDFTDGSRHYSHIPFVLRLYEDIPVRGPIIAPGRLVKSERGYFFIPEKGVSSHIDSSVSDVWTEWRYRAKMNVKNWVEMTFSFNKTKSLITALLIGEVHDEELRENFSRFGLQHLLAISGFHFSLLAFFTSLSLSLLFKKRATSLLMIGMSTLYLLFLGPSPSVIRAYAATLSTFLGQALFLKSQPLNHLGLGLLALAFYDPLWVDSMGAILSFGATFSLLLFADPLENDLCHLLPKRKGKELHHLGGLTPLFQLVQKTLRKSIALNLAVTLSVLPLSLYYFESFPLISLFYNLFFPLLVSLTLLLMLLSAITFVAHLNDHFTNYYLSLFDAVPKGWEGMVEGTLSLSFLVTWLLLIFSYGIYIASNSKD